MNTNQSLQPARRSKRLGAAILDMVILGLPMAAINFPMMKLIEKIAGAKSGFYYAGCTLLYSAVQTAVMFFILLYFYKNRGGSPGKLILKMVALKEKTGTFFDGKTFFIRNLPTYIITFSLSPLAMYYGTDNLTNMMIYAYGMWFLISIIYLPILFRKDRKRLHDLLAKTIVLAKAPSETPSF